MQERTNSKQKAGGPLGIRTSVWLVICGLLVTCVLLISVARRHAIHRPHGALFDQSIKFPSRSPFPRPKRSPGHFGRVRPFQMS